MTIVTYFHLPDETGTLVRNGSKKSVEIGCPVHNVGCAAILTPTTPSSPTSATKRAALKINKIPKIKIIFHVICSKTPFHKSALRFLVTKCAMPAL
jgi:hypothetical protein